LRDVFDEEFGKERSGNVKPKFCILEFNIVDVVYFLRDVRRANDCCSAIGLDSRSSCRALCR
jgi:hypothetical protein